MKPYAPEPATEAPARSSGRWRLFLTVLALLLVSRLAHLLVYQLRHPGEVVATFEPGTIARSLLAGEGYSRGGEPSAHKVPVYPLFLAASFHCFPGHEVLAVRLAQSLTTALAGALMAVLAERMFGRRLALTIGGALVLSPFLIKAHIQVVEASFAMALIAAIPLLAVRLAEAPDRSARGVALGVVSGLALLTLSASLAVVGTVLAWLAWRLPPRHAWRQVAAAAAVAALLLSPWIVRNAREFGRFVPLTSNLKLELWIGNNDRAEGGMLDSRGVPRTAPGPELEATLAGLDEVERNDRLGAEAWRFIRDNPGRFLVLRLRALFFFLFTELYWTHPDPGLRMRAATAIVLVQNTLAVAGMVLALRDGIRWAGLVCGSVLGFMLPYVLTHAGILDRYRLPIEPFLVAFAVYAAARLLGARVGGESPTGRGVPPRGGEAALAASG